MMITLPSRLAPLIEQRVSELRDSTDTGPLGEDYRSIAIHYGALPLYADIGGCIALKPTGEWLFFHSNQRWNPPEEVEPLDANAWRAQALRVGSKKYPELAEMLPRRPDGARDCEPCSGRGHFGSRDCAWCGGLGWR
ncbi:hypothetical protein [Hyalangium versicolor]|uniref:hypothetical protein n=1 Tax=Hyalangium versicolor TaxID=2861190 RepID=UPI001CCFE6B2|nr:hypothetical protein [Hyalangium versicolor]